MIFIGSTIYVIYLMRWRFRYVFQASLTSDRSDWDRFRPSHDPAIDTFKIEYLVGPAFILGLIFHYHFTVLEVLWSFSIFLESVAILPQLFMVQRTGEAEAITTHYMAALGIYRGLYIINWIYRYFAEDSWDPIAVVAGIVQTVLYMDFFYIYFTKWDHFLFIKSRPYLTTLSLQSTSRTEVWIAGLGRPQVTTRGSRAKHMSRSGNYLPCLMRSLSKETLSSQLVAGRHTQWRFVHRVVIRDISILLLWHLYLPACL